MKKIQGWLYFEEKLVKIDAIQTIEPVIEEGNLMPYMIRIDLLSNCRDCGTNYLQEYYANEDNLNERMTFIAKAVLDYQIWLSNKCQPSQEEHKINGGCCAP